MIEASETSQDWRASNKAQILSVLEAAGITLVTAYYSGSCDDGQIDRLVATGPEPENGPAPEIALPEAKVTVWTVLDDLDIGGETVAISEAIINLWWEEFAYGPAWQTHGRGEGVFLLNVARGTTELMHTQF
jgi:hypothetical protein